MKEVELSHSELALMMKDIAVIKVDVEQASEERKRLMADNREIKGILSEVRATLVTVSTLSEALNMMRNTAHERFNDIHKLFGGTEQKVSYQDSRIKELETWRSKLVFSRTVTQVWIAWLTAMFASAGTVVFLESIRALFNR